MREAALGAYAHQDVPFEKLVEELQPERDLSRTPLFQVLFAVAERAAARRPELPGLRAERGGWRTAATAKFDLTLVWREAAEGLTGTLEYNTDLFDAATIERLAAALAAAAGGDGGRAGAAAVASCRC